MKHLALFVLIMISTTSFAQKIVSGSLSSLKGESILNVEVDYSEAMIHGMGEADFAVVEQDWYVDKPEIISYIIEYMQDELGNKISVGKTSGANYTLVVLPQSIRRKGDTISRAILKDKDGNELCEIDKIEAEGGTFGTKLNLIKDGAKETGTVLGKYLKKQLKKLK
ncbi:MAG: hypothetical protein Q4C30_09440 [Bacteroidia bacterium]|nr:hypothetical protein [Bacteroidia bacterium]